MGYYIWESASSGESGFCKNPKKLEITTYVFPCEEIWDIEKIISCAHMAVSCYNVCKDADEWSEYLECALCLVDLGIQCADGICVFVTDCLPSEYGAIPLENEVVDWSGDFGDICRGE